MSDFFDQIIIGTGPSAFACHKFLPKGSNYLVLDSSNKINNTPLFEDILLDSQFYKINQLVKSNGENNKIDSGIIKKAFSGLEYQIFHQKLKEPLSKKTSNNFGGLSPFWGNQMIRYLQNDLDSINIGINYNELSDYYSMIEHEIGLTKAKSHNNLSDFYDLNNINYVTNSDNNKCISNIINKKFKTIFNDSLIFDSPLLAISNLKSYKEKIGQSLNYYGVNDNNTFNSANYFQSIANSNNTILDRRVIKIISFEKYCSVIAINDSGEYFEYKSKKVFLAAGCINTAEIIRLSLGIDLIKTNFCDHRTRLIPVFISKPTVDINYHINQLVGIRKIYEYISNYMSLYSLSSLTNSDLLKLVPIPYPYSLLFINILKKHFHVLQIWDNEINNSHIILDNGNISIYDNNKITPLNLKFYLNLIRYGIIPLSFATKFTYMGEGFHFVGTFARNNHDERFRTDRLGQLPDLKNIHLIDGSVIPQLTVKNSSLLQMANAARITVEAHK